MPYCITWEESGVFVECSGFLSMQEINEANGALQGDARFDTRAYQLWNLGNADMSNIREDEMDEPAATDWAAAQSLPGMKVALVVREEYAVKLCAHYVTSTRALGSKWECRLFEFELDAREWVEV